MENLENSEALLIKIAESGIAGLLPNCDGIKFFALPALGGEECVGAWFCGDDEYEQAVCGIVIMRKRENCWKIALNAREAELGTEFITFVGVTELGEMCFERLGREKRNLIILKCDKNEFLLKECEV